MGFLYFLLFFTSYFLIGQYGIWLELVLVMVLVDGEVRVVVAEVEALEDLSAEHRAALVLREVEGRTYREIAELQGCRTGTVMSRLFYARRAIQEKLRSVR